MSSAPAQGRLPAIHEMRGLGVRPASLAGRGVAFTIDLLIAGCLFSPTVVGAVLMIAHGPTWSIWPFWLIVIGAVLLGVNVLVNTLMHGLRGVTAGKAALGIRSISSETLQKPGFWRIVLRSLVLGASNLVPVIGPLLMFLSGPLDPARAGRSLLDRVGRCWAVDIRKGLNPLDRAALLAARRERDFSGLVTAETLVPLGTWSGAATWSPSTRSPAGVVGFAGTLAGWEHSNPEAGV